MGNSFHWCFVLLNKDRCVLFCPCLKGQKVKALKLTLMFFFSERQKIDKKPSFTPSLFFI